MIELLKMCGFEADEVETELPRIEKAFSKLGITAEDIERGKQRLTKYYDIELKGVRKIFRLCVLELVNSLLVREEGKKRLSTASCRQVLSYLVRHWYLNPKRCFQYIIAGPFR